ncbi:MAG: hypothetical protein NUV57_01590, partial [archaeon]|nr:hypothetical protein [archaeon]
MITIGKESNILVLLGIVILISGFMVAAIFFFIGSDKYKCENGISVDNPLDCSCPVDFECCNGDEYQELSCQTGFVCQNNVCEKQECAFECCNGEEFYKDKSCSGNETCEFRTCQKPECTFECCDDSTHKGKTCDTGFECTNNNCVEISPEEPELFECAFECCEDLEGFEDKACPV